LRCESENSHTAIVHTPQGSISNSSGDYSPNMLRCESENSHTAIVHTPQGSISNSSGDYSPNMGTHDDKRASGSCDEVRVKIQTPLKKALDNENVVRENTVIDKRLKKFGRKRPVVKVIE
ncbi:unnamed protein product, partial [Meganyctiphanes norvegica]